MSKRGWNAAVREIREQREERERREAREKLAREAAEEHQRHSFPCFYRMDRGLECRCDYEARVEKLATAFLAFAESVEKMR